MDDLLKDEVDGVSWHVRRAINEDLSFYKEVFSEKFKEEPFEVCFADGEHVRSVSTPEDLIDTSISFEANAQGVFTVLLGEEEKKAGFIILSAGYGPGIVKLTGHGAPGQCGNGYGESSVRVVVEKWAPEVRRLGLQFQGEPLSSIYVAVSPPNQRAIEMFESYGFKAARYEEELPLTEFPEDLDKALIAFYTSPNEPLQKETKYQFKDQAGEMRTFSYNGKKLTYHLEREVK